MYRSMRVTPDLPFYTWHKVAY